jgi:GDP-L-fucose synthase
VKRVSKLDGRKIWVAGHRGMVGSALVRRLRKTHAELIVAGRDRVDLTRQSETEAFIGRERPDMIILAAARVGGILANDTRPADFLYENLAIETNVIHAAFRAGTQKLLFLGSTCIYPRDAPQPLAEDALLTGPLEKTNEWYAIAKIAGIKLCQAYRRQHGCDYISAMPTNLFGPGDNYHPTESHMVPALIRRIHEAKESGAAQVLIWGSGKPRREIMHVDDCADACVFLLENYSGEAIVNIGVGEDHSITGIASAIADVIGWRGAFTYDRSKPDGTPRKLVDVARLRQLGWIHSFSLESGLRDAYAWFRDNRASVESGEGAAFASP